MAFQADHHEIPDAAAGYSPGSSAAGLPVDSVAWEDAPPVDSLFADTVSPVRATDVFGHGSVLHEGSFSGAAEAWSLSDWLPYQAAVLCLLIAYVVIASRSGGRLLSLFRTGGNGEEYRFLFSGRAKGVWIAGCFMTGLAAARVCSLWADFGGTDIPSRYVYLAVIAAVAVATVSISAIQRLVLRSAGALTLNTYFVQRLLSLRRGFFGASFIICSPFVLLAGLAPDIIAGLLLFMALAVVILIIIYFVYRTILLFFEQKVSILLWFLYLCTVEVMPYGIPVLAVLRSMQG